MKVGAIGDGDPPTDEMMENAVEALNLIVKDLQNDEHIYLWTRIVCSQALTISQPSYSLPTATPLFYVEKALLRDSQNDDSEVELIPWERYQDFADKDSTGTPIYMAINWPESKFYLYPEPDAADTLYYLGTQRLKDWDTAAGSGDLPSHFQRALMYLLAADLGEDYGQNTDKYEAKGFTLLGRAKRRNAEAYTRRTVRGAFRV
jgi:hypothetical protein